MALNIKDSETERLATEVAAMAGETKTRAVKVALEERRVRLARRAADPDRAARIQSFLENEVWPQIPPDVRGKPITKEEREEILGYEPEGF